MRWGYYYSHFYSGRNWSTERSRNLLKATQLKMAKSRFELRLPDSRVYTLNHCTMPWTASYAWPPAQITFADDSRFPLGVRATTTGRWFSVSPGCFHTTHKQGCGQLSFWLSFQECLYSKQPRKIERISCSGAEGRFVCCPCNKVNASLWDKGRAGLFTAH